MKENENKIISTGFVLVAIIFLGISAILIALCTKEEETELEPAEPQLQLQPQSKMDVTTKLEEETKLREIMNVNLADVFPPGSERKSNEFYSVTNEWGYAFIQFKDAGADGSLDLVSYSHSRVLFDVFDPETGFGGDDLIISYPNSEDWKEWVERYKQVLKDHAEKLRRQRLIRERK